MCCAHKNSHRNNTRPIANNTVWTGYKRRLVCCFLFLQSKTYRGQDLSECSNEKVLGELSARRALVAAIVVKMEGDEDVETYGNAFQSYF